MAKNITPRASDYSRWYQDVIKAAELADHAPVRGCMVIRPNGYALWEGMQRDLDRRFKETGHVNAYFPLLIPMSFLAKEAKHIEGFAMECAVVTHSGLEANPDGSGLRVKNELEEPYVVRPTSETVIGHMYAEWVQSWRDLPVLINQWANVMRWEMRTRLFLRTAEFLWQEGHTAHETAEEADAETLRMLDVYAAFAEEFLAIPVFKGEKTAHERFPGANHTYTIEAMTQDGKALQAGTSHNLGQNFSRAFNIEFEGRDQTRQHAWTTSWGVSTRLIGALIMAHSDDEGLILPPKVAPTLAAIVPIWKSSEEGERVVLYVEKSLLKNLVEDRDMQRANLQATGSLWRREPSENASKETHASYFPTSDESKKFGAELGRRILEKERQAGGNRVIQPRFRLSDSENYQTIAFDLRDNMRPGEKHYHWEQRGVPFRFEVGPRDVDGGKVVVKSRLGEEGEKQAAALGLSLPAKEIVDLAAVNADWFRSRFDTFQTVLLARAKSFRDANTRRAASKAELYDVLAKHGGFVRCFMKDDGALEEEVKADTKATVRLVFAKKDMPASSGACAFTGEPCEREVLFAVSY